MDALELPVLHTEIPLLGFYRSAFGETIDELGNYEAVADELLGVAV